MTWFIIQLLISYYNKITDLHTFFSDGVPLKENSNVKITTTDDASEVAIKCSEPSNEGVYSCIIENFFGSLSHDARIKIKRKYHLSSELCTRASTILSAS